MRCVACAVSWATWLLFTGVPARCALLRVRCRRPLGSCSPVCPLGALLCVCGVPGHLALVHRCARSVCCLCVRCPGPLGSCSPVCPLGALFCLCGVLGHLAPVHQCPRLVCCFACAVSWATWLLFTSVLAWCVVLLLRFPGPLGSCSPVCSLGVLFCLCGVLGHLAPVHRCATWCVVLLVRCPGPLGSCSPVCLLGVLFCLCGVLGYLAPVYRCARMVCRFACAVSLVTWLLFTSVPARRVVLLERCPGPLGSCSPVCPLGVLFCVCGVLGHLAPVHWFARSVRCFACAVSWATWLLFTGVPARCVACVCGVLGHSAPVHRCARLVRSFACACPGPLGSCSPVCPFGVLFCVCGFLRHLTSVHCCARSVRCFACAVSWATWLLFTGLPARCVACVCGVLGHSAPVHRCARLVR